MKALKCLVPALVLAPLAAGCILVSGQFLISFDLDSFTTVTQTTVTQKDIDLNTEGDYKDHKDDLKAIVDIAVLGKLTNNASSPIGVEVYMTPTLTSLPDEATVKSTAIKLWGPLKVAAGPGTTKTIDWNESAKLFTKTGKAALLTEVMGDGQFTLYAVGDAGTYDISVENGVLALTLDFGK
jgi:hypothetical protein